MKGTVILLCLAFLFYSCDMVSGLPWERQIFGRGCMCIKETSNFIHPRLIANYKIIPEGGRCRKREIIIQLRNQNVVCLKPETHWFNVFLVVIGKRRELTNGNDSNGLTNGNDSNGPRNLF
ncbi:interleukin-8-like [Pelobates fuscus]|uniref:interleukin-8-like n=1 Tax=Pelobates fuscus TaxID=191477 RepID=UPI002FE4C1CA